MPKKSQSENYDVVGGIFDFMFSEAKKKPPVRRRVAPPTGFSTSDAFTDTIALALERPGVIINNTLIGEFNRSLDITLGSVKLDAGEEIKINTTGLIDFLKSPSGYIDKVVKDNQAARKMGRVKFLGEVMDDFVATSWAHKYGNAEARAATIANATANTNLQKEGYKVAKAIGQYARYGVSPTHINIPKDKVTGKAVPSKWSYASHSGGDPSAIELDYMADRALELIGRKTFGQDWDQLSGQDKNEFAAIVSNGGDDILKKRLNTQEGKGSVEQIQKYLAGKYNPATAKRFERAVSNSFAKDSQNRYIDPNELKEKRITVFDPLLYKAVEDDNLSERINRLSGAPAGSPQEQERKMYEKTRLLLKMNEEGKEGLVQRMNDLRRDIQATTDPVEKARLQQELKDANNSHSLYMSQSFFNQLGRAEGYMWNWRATKELMGENGSNVVMAMITGQFFRDDKNPLLNPVEQKSIAGVKILVAKDSKNIAKRAYNKMGENLYYMTPRSIFNTLTYNGEGFAWLMSKYMGSLDSVFKDIDKRGASILSGAGLSFANIQENMDKLEFGNLNKYVDGTLSKLEGLLSSGKISEAEMKRLRKYLGRSKTFRHLTSVFSIRYRVKTEIDNLIKNQLKKYRVSVARLLLKNKGLRDLMLKTGANKLLGQWIAGGGIKMLLKSLVTSLAGAIGLVGTPLASFIISVGTWIAMDVVLKLMKLALEMIKWGIILGLVLVALVGIVASDTVKTFNRTHFTYGYTRPGGVKLCPATNTGTPAQPLPPVPPPSPGEPVPPGSPVPPPVHDSYCREGLSLQDMFDKVAEDLGLDGINLNFCPGSPGCESMSFGSRAYCYSRGSGNIYCNQKLISSLSCEWAENLLIHELIHQVQYENGVASSYTEYLSEWGADYLSGGGGGYCFNTDDGNTKIGGFNYPSSCTPDVLTSIAAHDASALNSSCKSYLDSYINGYCGY